MNRELSKGLNKKIKRKFPNLNLTTEDTCHITQVTLSTIAGFLRKKTTFNGARLLEYAGKSVGDFLAEEED
jgi:hypothetical protein